MMDQVNPEIAENKDNPEKVEEKNDSSEIAEKRTAQKKSRRTTALKIAEKGSPGIAEELRETPEAAEEETPGDLKTSQKETPRPNQGNDDRILIITTFSSEYLVL